MPTYAYRCKKCGGEFKQFQYITEEALHHCPVCGGEVSRLLSGGGCVIYKGAGFYVNDYAKKSSTSAKSQKTETENAKADTK